MTESNDIDALRRLAYDQHRAIGALRRVFSGSPGWDDSGAERLWEFGESDEGWALIEPDEQRS